MIRTDWQIAISEEKQKKLANQFYKLVDWLFEHGLDENQAFNIAEKLMPEMKRD